jgi:hypothetical protein
MGDRRWPRDQDVFKAGPGMAVSSVVTRCNSAVTGHEVGRCRRMRSLYCLTWVATLRGLSKVWNSRLDLRRSSVLGALREVEHEQ